MQQKSIGRLEKPRTQEVDDEEGDGERGNREFLLGQEVRFASPNSNLVADLCIFTLWGEGG